MFKTAVTTAAMLAALSIPALAQDQLHEAIVAAMGQAIEDPRYVDILAGYGLQAPDPSDPTLVNSADHPYPVATDGSLLDRVLDTGTLRLGWIAVGAPWSVPGADPSEPVGLAIEYWGLVQEYMSAHYGAEIALDWVEYTDEAGNNNMYTWLATSDDPDCTANGRTVKGCYDVIGGAYAINGERKAISRITPSYYPLNMSVVRTRVPLPEGAGDLATAEDIRAAMANPDLNIVLAGLPDTGEDTILGNFAKDMGESFTHADRTPGSNVLEYAQTTTDAHFVLGTNVRLSSTRLKSPEFCSDCAFIPDLVVFGGVGFATALLD